MSRYCVDCQHFRQGGRFAPSSCEKPDLRAEPDLIYGYRRALPAKWMRTEGACGPDGIHFEAKPAKRSILEVLIGRG